MSRTVRQLRRAYGLVLVLSAHVLAAAAPPALQIAPLPPERFHSLTGEQCGCYSFRKSAALADSSVVFSASPTAGRVLLTPSEHELALVSRRAVGEAFENTFSSSSIRVTFITRQVPFEQSCATYDDPPPHGSCFVGTMRVRSEQRVISFPVVQLCGC